MRRNYVKQSAIEFYVNFFTIIVSHDQKKFFFKEIFFLLIAVSLGLNKSRDFFKTMNGILALGLTIEKKFECESNFFNFYSILVK